MRYLIKIHQGKLIPQSRL